MKRCLLTAALDYRQEAIRMSNDDGRAVVAPELDQRPGLTGQGLQFFQ